MTLTAKHHSSLIPELVKVIETDTGQVVAKHNTATWHLWRTNHTGAKPTMRQIRDAVAAL